MDVDVDISIYVVFSQTKNRSDGYSHRGDGSPSQRTRVGDAYRQGSPSKRNSGRGESPLRVMRGSNDSHRLDPMRNNRYGSSSNSLAFNLNMGNALRPAPNTGGRINSGMSMDSMRQNGPVKARADVLGSAMVGPSSNSLNRRVPGQRPSTAPIGSRNSRPSSPAGRIGSRYAFIHSSRKSKKLNYVFCVK